MATMKREDAARAVWSSVTLKRAANGDVVYDVTANDPDITVASRDARRIFDELRRYAAEVKAEEESARAQVMKERLEESVKRASGGTLAR